MNETELKQRTKQSALRVMKLVGALPHSVQGKVIAYQLMKAGTSVGANYRAVCRGRSRADSIAKMGVVEEEADECGFWLELLADGELMEAKRLRRLRQEADELLAIFAAPRQTAARRSGERRRPSPKPIKNRKPEIEDS